MVRWPGSFTPESRKLYLQNGWPLGDDEFLDPLENYFGVHARPAKPGPRAGPKKATRFSDFPPAPPLPTQNPGHNPRQ